MCDRQQEEPIDDCRFYEEEWKHVVNAEPEITQVQYKKRRDG
jgi:hypothetical protein